MYVRPWRLKQGKGKETHAYEYVAGEFRDVFDVFGCPKQTLGGAFSVEIDYAGLEYALA